MTQTSIPDPAAASKAKVVGIIKEYNDVMAKAGRPYRYS